MGDIVENIITFLNNYNGAITIIIFVMGIIWSFLKFKEYLRDRRFGLYHKLIKELVEPENSEKLLKLDRQIAIIYELRNFPEYYEVSKRILIGLKEAWRESGLDRIIQEIDISIKWMSINKISRFFKKILPDRDA